METKGERIREKVGKIMCPYQGSEYQRKQIGCSNTKDNYEDRDGGEKSVKVLYLSLSRVLKLLIPGREKYCAFFKTKDWRFARKEKCRITNFSLLRVS